MKINLIEAMKFRSGEGVIARSGGRGVISSLNVMILNLGAMALRLERRGEAVSERPTIDDHAAVTGEVDGVDTDSARTVEQGGEHEREAPAVIAGRFKLIRDGIDKTLRDNAALVDVVIGGKSQQVPDPFHYGQTLKESMNFLCSSVQEVDPTLVKEHANALGITEDEVRTALAKRPQQRQQFMHRNREEILSWAESVLAADKDGLALSLEQTDEAFEMLEPIDRIKVVAAFDRGLFREWQRQIQLHVDGDISAMSNIGLINGVRQQVRGEINSWMKDAGFKRSYDVAIERGARAPRLSPAPVQPKPMTHEVVRKAA